MAFQFHAVDIIGEFRERDYGQTFQYRNSTNPWGIEYGYPHEICVADGWRPAHVMKTRAHVAIDEQPDGTPADRLWHFTKHTPYKV